MKIGIEVRSISNGWIVEDNSLYGEETFFEEYPDASAFSKKMLTRFGRDEAKYI